MERNREARRIPMAAPGNGFSRRRHRAGSFRDSTDEGPVVREGSRKKDRDRERERNRLNGRRKRRIGGERSLMVQSNLDDESSEGSVNDDEEYDEPSSLKMLPPASNISSVSSLSNHHNNQRKNFPPTTTKVLKSSAPWKKAADEMIGVSVPRKARSACTKRPHESFASSNTSGGEKINRLISTSPASILASPSSPSSSSVSVRKTKQKSHLPPKSSSCKLSPPVTVPEEIEMEIAEVLYGMKRMPSTTSKEEESTDSVEAGAKLNVEEVKSSMITLATNSSSSNLSAIAPRRKKPRVIKYDETISNLPSTITSNIKPGGEATRPRSSAEENSSVLDSTNPQLSSAGREIAEFLDSRSAEKKEDTLSKEETKLPKFESSSGIRSDGDRAKSRSPEKEKFVIDLMAPPPVISSSERDGEIEFVAAEAKCKVTEVETEAKPLLKQDEDDAMILESEEKKKPRTVVEAAAEIHRSERTCELKLDLDKSDHVGVLVNKNHVHTQPPEEQISVTDKTCMPLHMSMPSWPGGLSTMGYVPPSQGVVSMNTKSLSSSAIQPPQHLLFNQPRPKRCATHCYIARNIQSHQQYTKMNPFWHSTGSAPLYGTKACNLSLMPPAELQASVLGRSSYPDTDKNSQSTDKSSDTAQRNQIFLQQALPPVAANNIMHGPTFIFPMSQQPNATSTIAAAAVRPPNSGPTSYSGATGTSVNGSLSATPAGAQTMSFSYPGISGNETQYLAILQNNGYPYPVPAHVGSPPVYRGAPGQPIPFFNGSFYSSQMIQPQHLQPQKQQQQAGQMLQSHAPNNQNRSVSTDSLSAQKPLQNQQLRPPINHGNSQGFPTHKVQSQPLSFQQRQQPRENVTQHSETGGEDSPSTVDSRSSRSNIPYGQNYGLQMQPTNFGLMSSAAPGGGAVGSSGNNNEKKSQQQQQQVSKAGGESFHSQSYGMTFATFNGANIAQNHTMFHSNPEAARQGYHMIAAQAAQQKMNYSTPEDGKSGSTVPSTTEEQRKIGGGATAKTNGVSGGQSITFSNKHDSADASVSAVASGSIVDSSSRLFNLGSSPMPTSHNQQHMQRNQSHQPYTMYLQKQQQYATSVAASAARTKGPGNGYPDHNTTASPAGTTKFLNANSVFPQNLVQSTTSQVQSPQWKNNSPRTTNSSQTHSPSMLSPSSSQRNASHKQQSRPQQSQISFATNSKPSGPQGGTYNNQAPSPPIIGSPSTSSVSRNTGGSPKTTASSAANKASSTIHSSSQPSKKLQSASVTSSSSGRNNGPSVLGNITGSKSQAQLYFSNPCMQPQHQNQQQQQITMYPSGGYYIQRHQQQPGSAASAGVATTVTAALDPAKAIAAANNMKGGGCGGMGKTQQQQLVPPGFPYVHSVQVKAVEQKQQAGE